MGGGETHPLSMFATMFNFNVNHRFLVSRREYRACAVLLLVDRDTQCVYRLHALTKTYHLVPGQAYCVAGKVNGADKLYLVIESARPSTRLALHTSRSR